MNELTLSRSCERQPPQLPFGAPRAEHVGRVNTWSVRFISRATVSREGASHCARGGRGPHFHLRVFGFWLAVCALLLTGHVSFAQTNNLKARPAAWATQLSRPGLRGDH
jgi:hypothetical protein